MTTQPFEIGQSVNFTNGQPYIQTGIIVKIDGNYLTVIEDEAGMKLWDMGYAVGSWINVSQVK
jgi:hypothetical protein